MNIKVAAFSHSGVLLSKEIKDKLNLKDEDLAFFNKEDSTGNDLHSWVRESFASSDLLIFIGALQIAVRLISKELKSKLTDPAVIVIDDMGKYCIPILSGHVGGANEIAQKLALLIGAEAVITTSTDIHDKFAIDVFARKNDLVIKNPSKIKAVSSKILRGESITIYSQFKIEGEMPEGVLLGKEESADVIISFYDTENKNALQLIPKVLSLGTGCKKDIDESFYLSCFEEFLKSEKLLKEAFLNMATIDIKKSEKAILNLQNRENFPLYFFTKDELMSAEGDFSSSAFVKSQVGVDNVCERSAVLSSKGSLLVKKTTFAGITFAAAKKDITLNWRKTDE